MSGDLVNWFTDPLVIGIVSAIAITLNVIAFAVSSLRDEGRR